MLYPSLLHNVLTIYSTHRYKTVTVKPGNKELMILLNMKNVSQETDHGHMNLISCDNWWLTDNTHVWQCQVTMTNVNRYGFQVGETPRVTAIKVFLGQQTNLPLNTKTIYTDFYYVKNCNYFSLLTYKVFNTMIQTLAICWYKLFFLRILLKFVVFSFIVAVPLYYFVIFM